MPVIGGDPARVRVGPKEIDMIAQEGHAENMPVVAINESEESSASDLSNLHDSG